MNPTNTILSKLYKAQYVFSVPCIIYSKLYLWDSLMFKYITIVHPVIQKCNKSS